MNLYLISQTENEDYDTYDSAVVCAETETQARRIHPRYGEKWGIEAKEWSNYWCGVKKSRVS